MEYIVFFALCGSIGIVGIYDALEKLVRRRRKMKRTQVISMTENISQRNLG